MSAQAEAQVNTNVNTRIPEKTLVELHKLMSSMLNEARQSNWTALTHLDSQRRHLIGYPAGSQGSAANGSQHNDTSNKLVNQDSATFGQLDQSRYDSLVSEILAIDKEITIKIEKCRQSLADETRCVRAQLNAKKGYEVTNSIRNCTYS